MATTNGSCSVCVVVFCIIPAMFYFQYIVHTRKLDEASLSVVCGSPFPLSSEDVKLRCGPDATVYLALERYLILLFIIFMVPSLLIILPINYLVDKKSEFVGIYLNTHLSCLYRQLHGFKCKIKIAQAIASVISPNASTIPPHTCFSCENPIYGEKYYTQQVFIQDLCQGENDGWHGLGCVSILQGGGCGGGGDIPSTQSVEKNWSGLTEIWSLND